MPPDFSTRVTAPDPAGLHVFEHHAPFHRDFGQLGTGGSGQVLRAPILVDIVTLRCTRAFGRVRSWCARNLVPVTPE